MSEREKYVIGIDLGGTKIYAAVVDHAGKIIASARKRTKSELGFDSVAARMVACAREAVSQAKMTFNDIAAIGIGSPGPLDLKQGTIIETPNLGWKNAPLKATIENALQKPAVVDNDGNVGILGEYAYGAGHHAEHMVGLFIGTGIGGGIIVDGKLLHGFNENAGELGHMILDPSGPKCGCGRNGCMEAFASRLAIEREIRIAALQGVPTKVFDNKIDINERIRSKRLADAFAADDAAVKIAVNKSATYIGYGVANLLNIFNPQVVIIGGGVVEALGQVYINLIKETAVRNVFPIAYRKVQIVAAALKDDSAVLGAAVLAWDSVKA
jgi:glucokinase